MAEGVSRLSSPYGEVAGGRWHGRRRGRRLGGGSGLGGEEDDFFEVVPVGGFAQG